MQHVAHVIAALIRTNPRNKTKLNRIRRTNAPEMIHDEPRDLDKGGHCAAALPIHHRHHELRHDREENGEKKPEQHHAADRNCTADPRPAMSAVMSKDPKRNENDQRQQGNDQHRDETNRERKEKEAVPFVTKLVPRIHDSGAIFHHAIGENKPSTANHPGQNERQNDHKYDCDNESHHSPRSEIGHMKMWTDVICAGVLECIRIKITNAEATPISTDERCETQHQPFLQIEWPKQNPLHPFECVAERLKNFDPDCAPPFIGRI